MVGVIDPGVRALAQATRNRRVGVVGTVGTIRSGAYQHAIAALPIPVELVPASCPGFVEFVERDETRSDQVVVLAERLLAPVRDAGVDALLLGCTHYPFLARTIADVMGRDVVLVSSADETAFEVRAILGGSQSPGLGADAGDDRADGSAGANAGGRLGALSVFSSGDVGWFRAVGSRLFGGELGEVRQLSWPDPAPVADVVPRADRRRGVGGGRPGAASG